MKKILAFLLVICMLVSVSVMFTSCDTDGDGDDGNSVTGGNNGGDDEEEEEKPKTYKPNADPDVAAEALRNAGYSVYVEDDNIDEGIEVVINAVKIDGELRDMISIAYCVDSDAVAEAYEEVREAIKENPEEYEGCKTGKSGVIVWVGTDAAIKIASGKVSSPSEPEDSETPGADGGVSDEEWDAMISAANFENYTLTMDQNLYYREYDMTMHQQGVVKFADGMVAYDMTLDGDHIDTQILSGEAALEQKMIFESIYLALIADFENFTYDSAQNVYKTTSVIEVEIPLDSSGVSGTITMENALVRIDTAGKLLHFECDYTQAMDISGQGQVTVITHANWDFSDYGTTVIEDLK